MKLLLATRNKGKIKEITEVFGVLGWEIEGLPPDAPEVIEDGTTFEENARKKAETIAALYQTAALADDSGLEVEALDGRPGVYSARYAGENANDEENNRKLLSEMADIPAADRHARFVCVLALARPGEATVTVRGECKGEILTKPMGTGGFGYDPLFFVQEYGKTLAELSLADKNKISHRAKAIRALQKLESQGERK